MIMSKYLRFNRWDQCGVINIETLYDEEHVLWHIPYFFSDREANFSVDGPGFHFLGLTWDIKIYPNGNRTGKTVGFVELHIQPRQVNKDIYASFWVSILAEEKLIERQCYVYKKIYDTVKFENFIESKILESHQLQVAPEGTLTVKLVGKPLCGIDLHKRSERKILDGMHALTRDFQTLLSSEQESDVTIRVKSQVFRAHRLVLVTRSTVFAAMFRHDMKEKINGSIDIEDCEPSAFQEFLTFIYTGKTDNLSLENVFEILSLANKYDLGELKEICEIFLEENLRLDIVCDVLSAADTFNLVDIKKSAKELFLKNKKYVMRTKRWISFIRENPELLTEILMDAF